MRLGGAGIGQSVKQKCDLKDLGKRPRGGGHVSNNDLASW